MADRVRSMMRSGSVRGSMSHMGTTPLKYMVEFIVSHAENMKTADEVCLVWDRRGKTVSTQPVKVTNGKATFRETLAMETTLFRRASPGTKVGDEPKPGEELQFDEKKAKFVLRKGSPSGKALGKITLNLADYIKGVSGTVFADLKMSNSAKVSVKIVSKFLHVGKAKKDDDKGSEAGGGSDNESVMDDNDSVFGDDLSSTMSMEIEVEREVTSVGGTKQRVPVKTPTAKDKTPSTKEKKVSKTSSIALSPVSEGEGKSPKFSKSMSLKNRMSRRGSGALKESSSKRGGLRRKDKEGDELKKALDKLKEENAKLLADNKAAAAEIEALKDELAEAPKTGGKEGGDNALKEEVKSLRRKVKDLKVQNKALEADLDEAATDGGEGGNETIKQLKEKIQELEIALKREPKFMDVVNELKVMKVSFALANMEKEQAVFALHQYRQDTQN